MALYFLKKQVKWHLSVVLVLALEQAINAENVIDGVSKLFLTRLIDTNYGRELSLMAWLSAFGELQVINIDAWNICLSVLHLKLGCSKYTNNRILATLILAFDT